MRRLLWLALGLGAGATSAVLVSRWVRRQTQKLAPANVGRQAGRAATDLAERMVEAAGEFRAGAAEREREILDGLAEGEAEIEATEGS